ncbi:VOC family protein [Nonomuraea sp. NEAU-A123]|uniref:VOC family protein n=1 Tax=Nonomuraea sp. NEAU-A123 TaxID=2839649 RepID=UPI001BE4E055|nr:VOC family protein [Nonomuraea sp. NEAU-A123]MBT2225741.1 VOC family protein [Nonomuraea sp. NEAU-A123]
MSRQKIRFDHVGISVPDLEAATEWYCDTLDLTPAPAFAVAGTDLRGVMLLHESGYRIELLHRPGAVPGLAPDSALAAAGTLGYGHICLCVEDVDAEFARLVGAGATVRMEPGPSPRPGARVCFVADPYGNLIELIDRK